jgi:O-antigen ligase
VTAAVDRPARRGDLAGLAGVGAVGVATVAAGVLSRGNPVLTALPIAAVAVGFALLRYPLRWSVTAIFFLLLALEVPGDAADIWNTPLIIAGYLLSDVSGMLTHVKASGFEALAVVLFAVLIYRRASGSRVDGPGQVPVASAMRDALALYLLGFLYAEAIGLLGGVGLAPWKARYLLHVLVFFLLFQGAFRDAWDFAALGRATVIAAQVKGVLAMYVQLVAAPRLTGGRLAYATNHGDSILFTMALVILLVRAMEKTSRRAGLDLLLFAPLPIYGQMLNGRRIAWAMLYLALMLIYFISPWRAWKRIITRSLLIGAPVVLLYAGVGWNSSGGGVFGPVHKLRTMLDSSVDSSTFWREVEAWNVASSMRARPLVGIGLGGEYVEHMVNDNIATFYPDYRGWPHNTVLGLMLYAGLPGFVALWLLYPVVIFLAARAYRHARRPYERAAALACAGAVVCAAFLAWGDTGLHFNQAKLALAAAAALASKLAVSTGAWPSRQGEQPEGSA